MVRIRSLEGGVSALLILFGLYVASDGLAYGYLDGDTPGAGFFPLWIGVGIAVFSAVNLVKILRRSDLVASIGGDEIARVALSTAALTVFAWISGYIGMVLAAFPLMLAIGAIFGPREPRFYLGLVAVSAGMTAVLYLVFGVALAVPLL